MKSKEKANELIRFYRSIPNAALKVMLDPIRDNIAKQSSLIAIDEIMRNSNDNRKFWLKVKKHIENGTY